MTTQAPERLTLETYRDGDFWYSHLLDENGLDAWDSGAVECRTRQEAIDLAHHVAERVGAVIISPKD